MRAAPRIGGLTLAKLGGRQGLIQSGRG